MKDRGAPGVVVFDYDNDGDNDIFVTNGPGADHSLYKNQFIETGQVTFQDVAIAAGVSANAMDGTGAVAGDIDNDGDRDLLVLGRGESNILFRNNGNGTFTDITATSGVGGGTFHHISASMGDINGDGRLDIVVSNTFDWFDRIPIFDASWLGHQHNQLYLNLGNNQFSDVSISSGGDLLSQGAKPQYHRLCWT